MMRMIWPGEHGGRSLSEAELERLYGYPVDRRWLAVNFVASADGAVEVGGRARPLSTAPDRVVLGLGSDLADVILVGATTAMVEGFRGLHPDKETLARRRRHGLSDVAPTAVVTTGGLAGDAPVISQAAVPTLVLTCAAARADVRKAWAGAGAEVILAGDRTVDLPLAVRALADRGLTRVDCEGGPHLFGSLAAAGLVDELRLTISPLLVAGPAGRIAAGVLPHPADLRLATVLAADDTLLLRYLTATWPDSETVDPVRSP